MSIWLKTELTQLTGRYKTQTMSATKTISPDLILQTSNVLLRPISEDDFDRKREWAATEGVKAFVDPDGYRRFIAEKKAELEKRVAEESPAAPAK